MNEEIVPRIEPVPQPPAAALPRLPIDPMALMGDLANAALQAKAFEASAFRYWRWGIALQLLIARKIGVSETDLSAAKEQAKGA